MADTKEDILNWIDDGSIVDELSTPLSAAEIDALVESAKKDAGVPFERETIARMAATKHADLAAFMRLRSRLKDAKIGVAELDKVIERVFKDQAAGDDDNVGKAGKPLNLPAPEPWHEPVGKR
jgi:hypothetical protein